MYCMYMPQKPQKFGIKYWLICDVDTYYVLQAFPYTGKTDQIEERSWRQCCNETDKSLLQHMTKCDHRQFFYKPFYCQEAEKT